MNERFIASSMLTGLGSVWIGLLGLIAPTPSRGLVPGVPGVPPHPQPGPAAPESGEVKTGNYGFPDIFGNAYFPDMFGNYGFPNRKRLWKLGPRP